MAKLIIPTRNRPNSLGSVLGYVAKFYPGTDIIVADGSSVEYRPRNKAVVAKNTTLNIDYREYNPDMGLFDRLIEVLQSLSDDYIVMGADDDFPVLDVLAKGEQFLKQNPAYVSAFGSSLHFNLYSDGKLLARLDHAHPVTDETPAKRAQSFAEWPYSTTYSVTRRELLIERYKRSRTSFLVGFYDFKTGIHDAMTGKLGVVPGISYINTHNFNHSYLRPDDKLIFLRRSEEVLGIHQQFVKDLITMDGLDAGAADALATKLLLKRVASLVDLAPHRRPGFEHQRVYKLPIVQQQIKDFYAIFAADTPQRAEADQRLRYVIEALKSVSTSSDNAGESSTVESMAKQAPASAAAPAAAKQAAPGKSSPPAKRVPPQQKASGAASSFLNKLPWLRSAYNQSQGRPPKVVPDLNFEVSSSTILKK